MRPSYYYQRIGSIMRDNQYDRTVTGYRSGSLGKKLYKVMLDDDRVFDRKVERKNKEYNIIMMIDESGSMDGDQIQVAAESATMMAMALEKNHVNFSIYGFNKYIRLHKSFHDKFSKAEYEKMMHQIISSTEIGAACNHDYFAVLQLQEAIKGLDPAKTLVMMFVDGYPECGCKVQGANPSGMLPEATERLAKSCRFICFGIIVDRYVDTYYPNVVNIESLDQFMSRSLYAIQSIIRRG